MFYSDNSSGVWLISLQVLNWPWSHIHNTHIIRSTMNPAQDKGLQEAAVNIKEEKKKTNKICFSRTASFQPWLLEPMLLRESWPWTLVAPTMCYSHSFKWNLNVHFEIRLKSRTRVTSAVSPIYLHQLVQKITKSLNQASVWYQTANPSMWKLSLIPQPGWLSLLLHAQEQTALKDKQRSHTAFPFVNTTGKLHWLLPELHSKRGTRVTWKARQAT